jgi:hypothetical protein
MACRAAGWLRRGVAAVVLGAFVVGCTTTRPIDLGAAGGFTTQVEPEDRVSIVTTDGRKLAFEVVAVEPDAVVGADVRVERHEIAQLEVTSLSPARTAGLVGGTGLTVAAIAFIVFLAVAPALILVAAAP